MLQIQCPWCGVRDQDEFVFGGEARRAMPPDPEKVTDNEWADYLFNRSNPKGLNAEQWQHRFGCRRLFAVQRDTLTHEIKAIFKIFPSQSKVDDT